MESRPQIFACVGPESSGKTTLCNQLAEHFRGIVVPEFARNYLEERDGKYEKADLIEMGQEQFNLELNYRSLAKDLDPVFCDTDLLVIKVWHEFKFGESSEEINRLLSGQDERKYLLTYPDLEWEEDPLRENPNDLSELFHVYEYELQQMRADYRVIKGSGNQRLANAIEAVNQMKLG